MDSIQSLKVLNEVYLILPWKNKLNWSAESAEEGFNDDELEWWKFFYIEHQRYSETEQFFTKR